MNPSSMCTTHLAEIECRVLNFSNIKFGNTKSVLKPEVLWALILNRRMA